MKNRVILMLICIILMLCSFPSITLSDTGRMGSILNDRYAEIVGRDTFKEIQINDVVTGSFGYDTASDRNSMITEFIHMFGCGKGEDVYNAYEAGERAVSGIMYADAICTALGESLPDVPLNCMTLDDLTARCSGALSICGLDSAYVSGTGITNAGRTYHWEVYPFMIMDENGHLFENMIYIYYRKVMVISEDEEYDMAVEYYVADRDAVCYIFGQMMNLCPNISKEHRELMDLYIGLNDSLKEEAQTVPSPTETPMPTKNLSGIDAYSDLLYSISESFFADKTIREFSIGLGDSLDIWLYGSTDQSYDTAFDNSAWKVETEYYYEWEQNACIDWAMTTIQNATQIGYMLKEDYPKFLLDYAACEKAINEGGAIRFLEDSYLQGNYSLNGFSCNWESVFFAVENENKEVMYGDSLYLYSRIENRTANGCTQIEHIIADQKIVYQAAKQVVSIHPALSVETKNKLNKWMIRNEKLSSIVMPMLVSSNTPTPHATKTPSPEITQSPTPKAKTPAKFTVGDFKVEDYGDGTCGIVGYTGTDQNLTIPDRLLGLKVISIGGFCGCDNLRSIIIPKGVERIAGWAFEGCRNLRSISIPDGMLSIGESAFFLCDSLKSVLVPATVREIGDCLFSRCSGLEKVQLSEENPYFLLINGCLISRNTHEMVSYWGPGAKVSIPDGVIAVGEKAFYGDKRITHVTVPDTVVSIGKWAFGNCSDLKSIKLSKELQIIQNNAFSGCISLKSIDIPDGVTSIGEYAFMECVELKEVNIPAGVTYLGAGAFNLTAIESFSIPRGIKEIEDEVFAGCRLLKHIIIPDNIKSIGKYAFAECTNLETVTIPASVTSISESAFMYCESLEIIRCTAGTMAEKLVREITQELVKENFAVVMIALNRDILPIIPGRTNREVYLRDAICGGNLRKLAAGTAVSVFEIRNDTDGDTWYTLTVDASGEEGYLRDYVVDLN